MTILRQHSEASNSNGLNPDALAKLGQRDLPRLIRQFSRRFEAEHHTLLPAAVTAGHAVMGCLHSLGGAGMRSPALRAEAVEAIDNFTAVRRQER